MAAVAAGPEGTFRVPFWTRGDLNATSGFFISMPGRERDPVPA